MRFISFVPSRRRRRLTSLLVGAGAVIGGLALPAAAPVSAQATVYDISVNVASVCPEVSPGGATTWAVTLNSAWSTNDATVTGFAGGFSDSSSITNNRGSFTGSGNGSVTRTVYMTGATTFYAHGEWSHPLGRATDYASVAVAAEPVGGCTPHYNSAATISLSTNCPSSDGSGQWTAGVNVNWSTDDPFVVSVDGSVSVNNTPVRTIGPDATGFAQVLFDYTGEAVFTVDAEFNFDGGSPAARTQSVRAVEGVGAGECAGMNTTPPTTAAPTDTVVATTVPGAGATTAPPVAPNQVGAGAPATTNPPSNTGGTGSGSNAARLPSTR